jgi:hypothetical protein
MKHIFLTLLLASAAAGQNVSRLIPLKHVASDSVATIAASFGRGSVLFNQDPKGRFVTLSGPEESVRQIEEAIRVIDVPQPPLRNVESVFHIILATNAADPGGLPKELEGVAQQLRGTFGFKGVRLLETAVIRGRANSGSETSGLMPSATKPEAAARYHIRYGALNVTSEEKVSRARYNALRISFTIPYTGPDGRSYNQDLHINTDIDIREGQKVVVGKTSIDTASQSLFVVVSAKIVD